MKKVLLLVLTVVLLTMTTGCAWTKQHVQLNPQIGDAASDYGKGVQVGLKVTDERTRRTLGHRSVGAVGAEMTIDENPELVLREKVAESLRKNGFIPVEYNVDLDRNLKLELRDIKFYVSMGFWTGGVHTNVAFKAIATNNKISHEEFYRQEDERRVLFVPGAKENARDVNNTLSLALQKFHHDEKLMGFLAK